MEQRKYEQAADAFFFLTQISPLVKTFWMGLGHCERFNSHIERAVPAYLMAVSIEPNDQEAYLECMRGLLALGKVTEALDLLDMAISHADENSGEAWARQLRDTCVSCKEWIIAHREGEEVKYG